MDRDMISTLPKTILHDILSRMPEKDAARTSVLSKFWWETWSTYPILSFSDTIIVGTFPQPWEEFLRKRKNFIDHVERTLLRFRDGGLAIKQLKLMISNFDLHYMSQHVDHWLKLASESGVGVLEMCLPEGHEQDKKAQNQCYILPMGIIEAKSLYKLVLLGGIRVGRAFLNHSVKFFSLRVLSLWLVLLEDEQAIEHLISLCPLIEHVTLKCCSVLNHGGIEGGPLESRSSSIQSISMLGLPKLKKVDVQGIPKVVIDAPSLEYFWFCPGGDVHSPFKMNFDKCRNLRELHLWSLKSTTITDKWFLDLFPKFPYLECLKFVNCTMSETINISSAQLKVLELSNCPNLKEVNIDAPNLMSCAYCGNGASKPIISFLKSSSQLEVSAVIDIDFMDLRYLREFIQNFKPQNVLASLSLFIHNPIHELDLEMLPVSSTPPSIKHLDLRAVPKNETLYLPLVNSLLSSCRPETISLSLNFVFCSRAFIEFLYETLMRRKVDECFCSSGHAKCWWHGLKDVKVSSTRKTEENIDFKTMFDALPTFSHLENIIFRLEL